MLLDFQQLISPYWLLWAAAVDLNRMSAAVWQEPRWVLGLVPAEVEWKHTHTHPDQNQVPDRKNKARDKSRVRTRRAAAFISVKLLIKKKCVMPEWGCGDYFGSVGLAHTHYAKTPLEEWGSCEPACLGITPPKKKKKKDIEKPRWQNKIIRV